MSKIILIGLYWQVLKRVKSSSICPEFPIGCARAFISRKLISGYKRSYLTVAKTEMGVVADDLKSIFAVKREETARQLAQQFSERYGKRFSKAVEVLERGLEQLNAAQPNS